MRNCWLLAGGGLCLWLALPPMAGAGAAHAVLPEPVAAVMKRHRIPPASLSVFVQGVEAEEPLLAVNADTPRNPASTIKLLTTFVALEELTPAYTWKTEAYITGPIKDGVLDGDLYLKGYGDPYLVTEYFWRLLRGLRKSGLRRINGDLVVDDSYFRPEEEDPSAFDGRPERAYNVSPGALLLNFQSINFHLRPDPDGERVAIVADPNPGIQIDNRVKLTSGRCRPGVLSMQVGKQGGQDRVRFSGRYAAACGQRSMYRVVSDASRYLYGVFNTLWAEQGGEFDGELRQAVVPENAPLFYTAHSLPLSDIVRSINKYSNNVMTRQVVLTLGAERVNPPGTTRKGIDVIHRWLGDNRLMFPELIMDNGAGLSRDTRISSRHLGELLMRAYRSSYMPEFMSSLPIAAQDGTLRKRFTESELQGRVHIKTGLLDDVRGMAGYLQDRLGRRMAVVSLHNHSAATGKAGEAIQEALLEWLYVRD